MMTGATLYLKLNNNENLVKLLVHFFPPDFPLLFHNKEDPGKAHVLGLINIDLN